MEWAYIFLKKNEYLFNYFYQIYVNFILFHFQYQHKNSLIAFNVIAFFSKLIQFHSIVPNMILF